MKRETFWVAAGTLVAAAAAIGGILLALGAKTPASAIQEVKTAEATLEVKFTDHERNDAAQFATLGQKLDDLIAGQTEQLGHRPRAKR